MKLATSYLVTTKNLEAIINSIIGARAPERFTIKFLEDLGFKSTNDRLYIGVFKELGLIDENSVPTQKYFEFLDQTQNRVILAGCIKDSYEDLFNLKIDAYNMTVDEVRNKLKTLTQGQKSDKVYDLMAKTFKALCDYADWSISLPIQNKEIVIAKENNQPFEQQENVNENVHIHKMKGTNLHYNIQIHLPETRDLAVYDAIFQSLKKHLL